MGKPDLKSRLLDLQGTDVYVIVGSPEDAPGVRGKLIWVGDDYLEIERDAGPTALAIIPFTAIKRVSPGS